MGVICGSDPNKKKKTINSKENEEAKNSNNNQDKQNFSKVIEESKQDSPKSNDQNQTNKDCEQNEICELIPIEPYNDDSYKESYILCQLCHKNTIQIKQIIQNESGNKYIIKFHCQCSTNLQEKELCSLITDLKDSIGNCYEHTDKILSNFCRECKIFYCENCKEHNECNLKNVLICEDLIKISRDSEAKLNEEMNIINRKYKQFDTDIINTYNQLIEILDKKMDEENENEQLTIYYNKIKDSYTNEYEEFNNFFNFLKTLTSKYLSFIKNKEQICINIILIFNILRPSKIFDKDGLITTNMSDIIKKINELNNLDDISNLKELTFIYKLNLKASNINKCDTISIDENVLVVNSGEDHDNNKIIDNVRNIEIDKDLENFNLAIESNDGAEGDKENINKIENEELNISSKNDIDVKDDLPVQPNDAYITDEVGLKQDFVDISFDNKNIKGSNINNENTNDANLNNKNNLNSPHHSSIHSLAQNESLNNTNDNHITQLYNPMQEAQNSNILQNVTLNTTLNGPLNSPNFTPFTLITTLSGHTHIVTSIIQLKNGNIATGSYDRTIKIWDQNNFSLLSTLVESGYIFCLLEIEENIILCGNSNNEINQWDLLPTPAKTFTYKEHYLWVNVLLRIDNDYFASCSNDATVKIWNIKTRSSTLSLVGHVDCILAMIIYKNNIADYTNSNNSNNFLCTGSADTTIKIWDINEKKMYKNLKGHSAWVKCLCQMDNGLLLSGSDDKTIIIWKDLKPAKILDCGSSIRTIFQINEFYFSTGGFDRSIKFWRIKDFKVVQEIREHKDNIICIYGIKDGKIASCSNDKTIKIWGN